MNKRKEFGDFQTPRKLATKVTALVADVYGNPDLVVEPTAGVGSFLNASKDQWGRECQYEGYEINRDYVTQASETLKKCGVKLYPAGFFYPRLEASTQPNGIGQSPSDWQSSLGYKL